MKEEYLSEIDKEYLKRFVSDKGMFVAVQKVLLKMIFQPLSEYMITGVNKTDSNEHIGEITRAKAEAVALIKDGFREIGSFEVEETKKNNINIAR